MGLHGNSILRKNLAPLQDFKATDVAATGCELFKVRRRSSCSRLSVILLTTVYVYKAMRDRETQCLFWCIFEQHACCSWPLSGEVSSPSHICCDREHLLLRSSPRIRDILNYCRACSSGAITICDQRFVTVLKDSNTRPNAWDANALTICSATAVWMQTLSDIFACAFYNLD